MHQCRKSISVFFGTWLVAANAFGAGPFVVHSGQTIQLFAVYWIGSDCASRLNKVEGTDVLSGRESLSLSLQPQSVRTNQCGNEVPGAWVFATAKPVTAETNVQLKFVVNYDTKDGPKVSAHLIGHGEKRMFDLDQFIADCREAVAADPSHKLVREIVARAVAEPLSVMKGVGEPKLGHVDALYRGDDLTILNVVWPPLFTIMPHEHRMWAVIGVYTGAEDNMFWRRKETKIEAAGACSLRVGDAEPLGRDIVHSVTNPIEKLTGAIHVYGGDFFAVERSEWDPETLIEKRYDIEKNMRLFQEANARLAAA